MQDPVKAQRLASTESIVDKGWNLISHNTELIFFIALGFVEILAEAAGYRPFIRLNDLLPTLPNTADNTTEENNISEEYQHDYYKYIYKISHVLDSVKAYSVHITLATHILLPYPVFTERQKVLLVPWLIVTFLRSVLRELVVSMVGIALCASYDVFHLPCLQYSGFQGAQLCFIIYFWSSVHNFYHFLRKKNTGDRMGNVISRMKRSGTLYEASPLMERVLSVTMEADDDDTEVTLVQRAAMAWIAREILENDSEYVTDRQFSQYLASKATRELKQALRELAERKKGKKRSTRKPTEKEKIEESLEFMKMKNRASNGGKLGKVNAFKMSESLSKRDPIGKIKPLVAEGKPLSADISFLTGISVFSDESLTPMSQSVMSATSVDTASQTEPATHRMSKLFDILESQQKKREIEKIEEENNGYSM